jgi:pyruvate/2-oxoglutarate/acetoin dehydrogenase E1 component
MAKLTVAHAIRTGLERRLEADPAVLLLGEDIRDPYGGAFRVTRGLSERFPDRVINTPISEAATVGVAVGMALRGLKPVVEIMFGDFLALAADQVVNHAAKFTWMYNGAVAVPLVIRAPMGGRRGYGPTHSQSLERMFLSAPGLRVVAPTHRHDPAALIEAAVEDPNPVLFVEGKLLYAVEVAPTDPRFDVALTRPPYPAAVLSNAAGETPSVTVVTYSGMLPVVEQAMSELFEEDEVTAEILAPSLIGPLDTARIGESVARTGRLLVAEEGPRSWGWGAEVVARVVERWGGRLRAKPVRVAGRDLPLPTARPLEDHAVPSAADVRKAVEVLMLQQGTPE